MWPPILLCWQEVFYRQNLSSIVDSLFGSEQKPAEMGYEERRERLDPSRPAKSV